MPGATTADLDRAAREVLDRRGRPLELPRLPRVPGGGLHLAQRGDRARHPRRPRARGRRHRLDRLRGDHRGLARRRRDHGPGRRGRRRVAAADRGHPARRCEAAIDADGRRATGSATSAPRSEGVAERPGFAVVREYVGPRHRHRDARGARRSRTTGRRAGGCSSRPGIVLAIEPMVNAGTRRDRGSSTTAGPSSPPTAAAPPTSSTPSPSPTTAPRSSPCPG